MQLKDEAVSLVDVLAPPDFILNSPIGHSNGKVSASSPELVSSFSDSSLKVHIVPCT